MRIALHAATLRGSGSALIGSNILSEILASGEGHEFHVWTSPRESLPQSARVVVERVNVGRVGKLLLENVIIPRTLQRIRADALFSLGDTASLRPGVPHLLLVQQAYLAASGKELDFRIPAFLRMKFRAMEKYFAAALPTVGAFTVQTDWMKHSLAARWSIAPDKIHVVPSAVSFPFERAMDNRSGAAGLSPYICYVADLLPHKNHEMLPRMMSILSKADSRIRLKLTLPPECAPSLEKEAMKMGILENFDFLGRLNRRQVFDLYSNAIALVMPSKLESFGLPLYEAMATGCPIVASDRPFAREACADAALYADPDAPEQFAAHVSRLMTDIAFAVDQSRRASDRHNVLHWSWADAAAKYLSILEHLR